jgi:hypothetical protein
VKNRLVQCKGGCGLWYHSRVKCGNIKPHQDDKWICPNCPIPESEADEEADAEDASDADGDPGEEYGSAEESVADDAEDGKSEDGEAENTVYGKAGASDTNEMEIKKEVSSDDVGTFTEDEEEDEEDLQSLPDDSGTDPDYTDGEATDATSASGRSVQKEPTFRRYKVEFPIKQENAMTAVGDFRPAQMFSAMTAFRTPKVIQDACRVDRLLGLVTNPDPFRKERDCRVTFRRCRTLSPAAGSGHIMPTSLDFDGDQPMTD